MNIASPIVVDLGKASENDIRQLQSGIGPIADDVQEVMRIVRSNAWPEHGDRVFVPVVVIYEQPADNENEPAVQVWNKDLDRAPK